MNKKRENINLLIGKVAMIGLFILIIFAFKNTDCSGKYRFCQSGRIVHVLNIDKPPILDKSAILVSQISSKDFNGSIVACKIFAFNICNKNNFLIICSNNKVNQLLKNCNEKFLIIKPQISDFASYPIRTSLNNEEISSIS